MKLLAIDASTTNFGLAYFESRVDCDKLELVNVENIKIKGVLDFKKMIAIHFAFSRVLNQQIKAVVFERPVPVRFSQALTSINQVMGILIGLCIEKRIPFTWIHVKTIKCQMGITAHGKEGKLQAIEITKKMYPKLASVITTDHIADAILVGETSHKLKVAFETYESIK